MNDQSMFNKYSTRITKNIIYEITIRLYFNLYFMDKEFRAKWVQKKKKVNPGKRWGHTAVIKGKWMYIIAGQGISIKKFNTFTN